MKRIILIIAVICLLVVLSYSRSEAQAFIADSPFTSSFIEIIPDFNIFGDHAVLTFESTDANGSFFAVLLDVNGTPVASSDTFGWSYLFADVQNDGTLNIFGSDTGLSDDWHFIGNF
jgi:hypothetical protein